MIEKITNETQKALLSIITLATIFLIIFLGAKIISEIISWNNNELYPSRTITVNGEGEALAVPDIATFTFTVSSNESSVDVAQNDVTAKINQATNFLKDSGIDDRDIKTSSYNIYPQYNNRICTAYDCPPYNPEIVGYEVSQATTVKVRQAEEAGRLLTELGKIGVTNVSGLSFTIDDEEIYKEQARDSAIADAGIKAEKLAEQLGVDLKNVVSFGEDQPYYDERVYDGYGGSANALMTKTVPEISVGENSYSSRVWITYEID